MCAAANSTLEEPAAKRMKNGKENISENTASSSTSTGVKTQKKSSKKAKPTCVDSCVPGKNSGCTIRGRGKPAGNLSCAEVDRRLEALGVSAGSASKCTKAAILKGIIEIKGEDPQELEQVICSEQSDECGHVMKATVGDLLKQPDYAGLDYEDGLQEATVTCGVDDCEEGRTYVTGICKGEFRFDSGKFHNHCMECPGFGVCIYDYREAHCDGCGKHYFAGNQGFPCPRCKPNKWERRMYGGDSDEYDSDDSENEGQGECSVM